MTEQFLRSQGKASETGSILEGKFPSRFVYSPNYWQWFRHRQNHGLVPEEIRHCMTLTDLYRYLGVDIFSRNIYCDPEACWFGGLYDEIIEGFGNEESVSYSGSDKVISRKYISSEGILDEKLTYVFNESTLVQNKFLFEDYYRDLKLFRKLVSERRWKFRPEKFEAAVKDAGNDGIAVAGEYFSPLKMLHMAMGPVNAVYFLAERPVEASELLGFHEEAQIESLEEALESGVRAVMSMDNLDTMFHSPDYVEAYSSSFYTRASALCHKYNAKFFIHACGQQKDNIRLIDSYGVDGLEGVASPPLGDILPEEAMCMTRDSFIITGGISAMETRNLSSGKEIFDYVEDLFRRMLPYKNRFIFASSCNTAIDTQWETILNFRDAWLEFREMV